MDAVVITRWRRYLLVQPPLMIILFAYALSAAVMTDLLAYRTCTITFRINETECLLLHENGSSKEALRINKLVQPEVSLIIMSRSLIENVLPAFMSLFMGPWSDKYGRKPLLLIGHLGLSMMYILLSILFTMTIDPWYTLLAFVPAACCGSSCLIFLASFCYVCDISKNAERAWQFAYMEILIMLGIMFGNFVGPFILHIWGSTYVFVASAVSCICSGLYILFCIPETIHSTTPKTWKSLCNYELIKELVESCTKKRDNFDRPVVWCCILCLNLLILPLEGELSIGYLFANARMGWDVESYAHYVIFSTLLSVVGTFVGAKAVRYCTETIGSIIVITLSIVGALVKSFSYLSWHMYLVLVVTMFGGTASPAIRAILSKALPLEDAGKVFSLTVSIETLTPPLASSIYGLIYSHFMPPLYPSPVWLVSVGLFILIIAILIYVHVHIRNRMNFVRLVEVED